MSWAGLPHRWRLARFHTQEIIGTHVQGGHALELRWVPPPGEKPKHGADRSSNASLLRGSIKQGFNTIPRPLWGQCHGVLIRGKQPGVSEAGWLPSMPEPTHQPWKTGVLARGLSSPQTAPYTCTKMQEPESGICVDLECPP